jgi:acetyltransferase-like isoleucine patch superfamily enzyme
MPYVRAAEISADFRPSCEMKRTGRIMEPLRAATTAVWRAGNLPLVPPELDAHFMPQIPSNVTIGENTVVEDDASIGWRYHAHCGSTIIGRNGIIRKGTIIYSDVKIGDYFQTGHHVVIRAKVRMGDYCTVLNHSCLEGIIRFGDGIRIMSNVYIPTRTWFGDNIFVGPGVTFLNGRVPGRIVGSHLTPRGATIEDDVMIGGGCTILPGIRIGERSFIAAGAVVTKDVPPRSFVKGVPGRAEPLPEKFDRPNDRALTRQPLDIWHPLATIAEIEAAEWPAHWGQKFAEA